MLQKSVAEKTKQKHILQKREGIEKNLRFLPAVFLKKNKKNQTFYKTPYGQMLIGVNTRCLQVDFEEDKIAVQIDYELDVNHEPMADCKIRMNIVSKDSGKFSVLS